MVPPLPHTMHHFLLLFSAVAVAKSACFCCWFLPLPLHKIMVVSLRSQRKVRGEQINEINTLIVSHGLPVISSFRIGAMRSVAVLASAVICDDF